MKNYAQLKLITGASFYMQNYINMDNALVKLR